jgi:hypothetical protein
MKDAMQKTIGGLQKQIKEHRFSEATGFNEANQTVQGKPLESPRKQG